jgi:2-polyprenyl-3-methyl-5-hydroxy-6-metoxy-1,4-benzoquinol methylase
VQPIRSLFERPSQSYELDPRALDWILADPANPLNRLVNVIPKGATVLDIGAGNGLLARLLHHAHSDVAIDGVEPDGAAVMHAKPWYRDLFNGSVEQFLSQVGGSIHYDYIVLADVIEHLPNPQRILQLIRERLGRSGKLCISTPNVAFASVRVALLNGVFEYVDSGILERTHLRFFTLRSLEQLFAAVELHPEAILLLKRNPLSMEICLDDFRISPFLLRRLLKDDLASVYQFLFVLRGENCRSVVTTYGDPGRYVVLKYLLRRLAKSFSGMRNS